MTAAFNPSHLTPPALLRRRGRCERPPAADTDRQVLHLMYDGWQLAEGTRSLADHLNGRSGITLRLGTRCVEVARPLFESMRPHLRVTSTLTLYGRVWIPRLSRYPAAV